MILSAIRSASAEIVSEGFTPSAVGTIASGNLRLAEAGPNKKAPGCPGLAK